MLRLFLLLTCLFGLLLALLAAGLLAARAGPSPTGWIAFSSDRSGEYQLYLMRPDGRALRQLSDLPGSNYHPAWSPDGGSLAFVSTASGRSAIYRADIPDKGRIRRVTPLTSGLGGGDFSPVWSPAGRWIVFDSRRSGINSLWAVPASGGRPIQLTDNALVDGFAAFSRDGEWLYFRSAERTTLGIYRVRFAAALAGHARRERVIIPDFAPNYPVLSPDGDWLVFAAPEVSFTTRQTLRRLPLRDALAGQTSSQRIYDTTQAVHYPRFSPDGEWLVFNGHVPLEVGNAEIMRIRPDGADWQRLTNSPAADWYPAWSPLPPAMGLAGAWFIAGGGLLVVLALAGSTLLTRP